MPKGIAVVLSRLMEAVRYPGGKDTNHIVLKGCINVYIMS
jgi:hypothetical protein